MPWKIGLQLLLLVWLWPPPAADAQKLVGKLILTKGVVKIRHLRRESFVRIPNAQVPLYEKDVVQTGPAAKAKLKLRLKGTEVVRLYPNSYIILEAVQGSRTTFALPAGKALFSVSRPSPLRTRFEVRSRNLIISAMGTRFLVGAEASATYVLALEGQVKVISTDWLGIKAAGKPGTSAELAPNQAVFSGHGGEISAVIKVSDGEKEDIESEDGLDEFRELEPPLPAGQDTGDEGA